MTILVKKVFISSKPTFVYLLCPPLCGPFSIQESAAGGLSYKGTKSLRDGLPRLWRSFLFMDFSLLSPLEFFVVPKNGDGRNNKPPAMRVRVDCYTKNHLSVYNRVVQAVLQKGKVIYGEERKFTCAYEMDVQISYRLHT